MSRNVAAKRAHRIVNLVLNYCQIFVSIHFIHFIRRFMAFCGSVLCEKIANLFDMVFWKWTTFLVYVCCVLCVCGGERKVHENCVRIAKQRCDNSMIFPWCSYASVAIKFNLFCTHITTHHIYITHPDSGYIEHQRLAFFPLFRSIFSYSFILFLELKWFTQFHSYNIVLHINDFRELSSIYALHTYYFVRIAYR